jgi:hypothetical protein
MPAGRIGFSLVLAATAAAAAAGPAEGQRRLTVTPFAGGLIPTTELGQLRIGGLTPQPFVFRGQMRTSGALGGRMGLWLTPRWGVEGSYFYSKSDFSITNGPFTASIDAEVQGGTFKAFYQATSEGTGTDLVLSAGLVGMHHGGRAFQLASEQFDVGGAVGGGLYVQMSPQVTLRIDGDLLIYRWSAGPAFPARTQTDVLMTAGLAFRFGT